MNTKMLIGCDPEFVYFDVKTNKFISADKMTNSNSDLGCDGHVATGEMRPTAKKSAKGVIAQIHELFAEAEQYTEMQKVGILAGHYKFGKAIGGHIHMSGFSMDMVQLSSIMDSLFNPLSDLIDNIEERTSRKSSGYGSGYRSQGTNWIEYRMPGSWLLSPDVAYLNLGLAECIGKEYDRYALTGDYSIFEAISSKLNSKEKRMMIMNFIQDSEAFNDKSDLLDIADNIFSNTPLDWSVNIKEYWL